MENDVEMWLKKDGEEFLKSIGVRKAQVILDFGCGEGHYTIPAVKVVGERGKIYAIDKDKEVLNKLVQSIKKNSINPYLPYRMQVSRNKIAINCYYITR